MCNLAGYLREQTEKCREMAITSNHNTPLAVEWAQASLLIQRALSEHAKRCSQCKEIHA